MVQCQIVVHQQFIEYYQTAKGGEEEADPQKHEDPVVLFRTVPYYQLKLASLILGVPQALVHHYEYIWVPMIYTFSIASVSLLSSAASAPCVPMSNTPRIVQNV